ncbi:MAG: hypothetical protein H2066_02645 [Candidatus Poseidoniales archaeon]|nr:hypothetical protein [Candidatus Poseidoniales archaeon]
MGSRVPFILIALLLTSTLPIANATSGRAVNVDLDVTSISITYPDSVNESLYKMFSSNYPIVGFNKPENLYVTDGVVEVEMNINIVIENLGTSQSGFVDVEVLVLHNEYSRFELLNTTRGLSPIQGSSSGSIDVLWTPYYSGNHTLLISVTNTVGDDDANNNVESRHLTVAHIYDNCIDMSLWTSTGDWKVNSDAFISQSNSFHVGNGQFSTYSSMQTATLTSPVFNLADDTSNHNAAIGYSFFYTGGAGTGDQMKGYIKDDTGNWDETFTMQGNIDNNFQDGINWQTFSAAYNGKNSPLIPVDNSHFHSTTQLRFVFTSDATGNDIGFWIDDLVIIYDQAAKIKEYNVDLNGVSALGGLPGDWSTTRMEISNNGNISERFTPTASGIPAGWTHYFSNPSGVSISSSGIELLPGESRQFDLRVLVDENASQGNLPVTVNVTSNQYQEVEDGIETVIKILPDRLPEIIVPEFTPRCTPGNTCNFPVVVQNIGDATDVFAMSVEDKNVPQGWSIDLAWNQSANVLVRTDNPQHVWLTATIPTGVEPDVTAEIWLTATSSNDSRRYDTKAIEVAAAMISNAEITVDGDLQEVQFIDAGQSIDISFRIWNNASRIDIFRPSIDFTEITGWTVELLNSPDLAISPGSSSTYTIRITAPINAQANDMGPMISPKALSMRSGDEIIGNGWQGIRVNSLHDVSITILEAPTTLSPGVPVKVSLEVTNNGNGAEVAVLNLPWTSDSWHWWALVDGANVTEGIPLSVSYDLENIKQVDLWIILPSLEAPGEFHEITIEVNPSVGTDISSNDNSVMFEAITETIRQPRLDGYGGESVVETNSTHSFNATAWNIGNAADTSIRARLIIQTSPPSSEVIGFLSTESGLSKSAGEWINLNLGATQSELLLADIIISPECELNTIISVTIELEGGADEFDRPITKTVSAALMVGERRHVEVSTPEISTQLLPADSTEILWVNLTSTSTQGEIFDISAEVPEGWGIICDGNTVHLESTRIEMDQGHLIAQSHDMRCEVIRQSGDYSGTINIQIDGTDSRISHTITKQLTWQKPATEDSSSSMIIVSGVSGLVVIGIVVLFILRRGDDEDYEDDVYDEEFTSETPVQGPPATAFAGPPATAVEGPPVTSTVVDPAIDEYNRQLEEYNRKMAEYQAWQAAQGSQVEVDSTNHE